MTDKRITALNEVTSLSLTDLIVVEDDPSGSPETKKCQLSTLLLDEDDMASDSATAASTQQAVKAYVDTNAVTSADAYWGCNLVKNYPSLELADGAQPEWWEVTNDPTLTEEDATGETIPQIHERVLKLVVSADGGGADYLYQDFDDADEPILDDNVTKASAGCWVYTADAGTVTLELYDVDGTASLGTDTTTTTSTWVWLEVLDKTYQDSMRWRVTHSANSATVYVAMPGLNVGSVVLPWEERGVRFVEKRQVDVLTENPADTNWADVDFSSYVSSLGARLLVSVKIYDSGDINHGFLRRNGDSTANNNTTAVVTAASSWMASQAQVLCDDSQVIEEAVGATSVSSWSISLAGYWEWA